MQPTFPHRPLHLSRSLVRKTRTSTARSATFAEAAERPNSQLYDHRKVLPFRNSIDLDARGTSGCRCAIVPMLRQQKGEVGIRPPRSRLVSMREKNMRQNHIQSKNAKLFHKLLTAIQMARRSLLAAVGVGMAASTSLSAGTAHAQEYPWCVSRESYLYCFYKTQQQCQWTASGIGGCRSIRICFSRTSRAIPAREL